MHAFPSVQFYDYCKVFKRMFEALPANYHLTFSATETNAEQVAAVLEAGKNAAIVFRDKATVARAMTEGFLINGRRYRVVSGDETDLRFLDDVNVIVGLYAKGQGKKDTSGFVRDLPLAA